MFEKIDEQCWKAVIDTLQEGLMLVDPDGKIMFVNRAFEALLGYANEELRGKSCEIFQCDRCFKTRADGFDKYCALFKEKRGRSNQCVFRKKDGTALHLLKNAALIRNKDGVVLGGVETLIDLSTVIAHEKTISNLRHQLHYDEGFQGIIANSLRMQQVFDLARSAAQSEASLIIYGESGTGKELLAAAIHRLSRRREEPFIKVNCAALNENLLESELFGHIKGAFTGADYNRVGRFEAAHGGTIFLDEIGDLPLTTQTKILRVLQEKEIERVGDHRPVKIDVRVFSATHKDLKKQIQAGLFREDLYYRVGVIPIHLPPLRERVSDIPLLVDTFIKRISEKTAKRIHGISRETMDLLVRYPWPGNVRELQNTIEYAFVLCSSGTEITPDHLPGHIRSPAAVPAAHPRRTETNGKGNQDKRQQFIDALRAAGGNQSKAARMLGVSRVTIWKWMKKYGIAVDAKINARK